MFLQIIVKLIPILGSVDLLDVIQSVDISPGQDANNVVDPEQREQDFSFEQDFSLE